MSSSIGRHHLMPRPRKAIPGAWSIEAARSKLEHVQSWWLSGVELFGHNRTVTPSSYQLRLQVNFWNQAVCSHDPGCDLAMYQMSETHLFTLELETINEAIGRLDDRLKDPAPIPFEKMFSLPLQMSDGSMWFEGNPL